MEKEFDSVIEAFDVMDSTLGQHYCKKCSRTNCDDCRLHKAACAVKKFIEENNNHD